MLSLDQLKKFSLTTWVSTWTLPLFVLIFSIFMALAIRNFLKKLKNKKWIFFSQFGPSFSGLCYLLGLRIFLNLAPLDPKTIRWADNGIYIFTTVMILRIIQLATLTTIEWSASQSKTAETLHHGFIPLLRNIITLLAFFAGSILILEHFHYDVMSLVTALGVSSLAVGIAAKDTLSNMISGFILIIDRNLKPGDRIQLGKVVGDVELIGLRSTQIRMFDGNFLIVPNSDLVNTKIVNLSLPNKEMMCNIFIRIRLLEPFATVKDACLSILQQSKKITRPSASGVYLVSIAEGSQLIRIGFWIGHYRDSASITSEINERLLSTFQKQDILISTQTLNSLILPEGKTLFDI
jgi:small-conductance mechanosensitive channel